VAAAYAGTIVVFAVMVAFQLRSAGYPTGSCQQAASGQESFPTEAQNYYPVQHIFDGDTFSVEIDGKTESVRVIGIDAPETGEAYTEKECFAQEAKERAIELLSGKWVRLEADPTQEDRDQYSRLLRYVFLEDGTFFNQVMVEEGYAEEYTFKGSEYQHQQDFLQAQRQAEKDKSGLWSVCY